MLTIKTLIIEFAYIIPNIISMLSMEICLTNLSKQESRLSLILDVLEKKEPHINVKHKVEWR